MTLPRLTAFVPQRGEAMQISTRALAYAVAHHIPREKRVHSMSRSIIGARWSSRPSLWVAAGVASATAVAVSLGGGVGTAFAGSASAPVVTRAALDPSLVAGRGASVDFSEQEAENAKTNGAIIGPDTSAYTLPAEASGRSAVKLAPGQYVEFTLPKAANAISVRYSIPDAPNGGGITAPLNVTVNGGHKSSMTLTSQYAWLYNLYPFSNDPNAGVLHPDWWITECSCVPNSVTPPYEVTTPFRPNHFYDEQRLLLGRTYQAGDKVRLTVPSGSNASATVIDLLDSQLVGLPKVDLMAANVLLFGADPFGKRDSADAFDKAIAFAKKSHLKVYIPPGTYQVNRHIIVDNVTIEGAGSWYTIIKGHQVDAEHACPRWFGSHRRRLLRQGRIGRWQHQRPPLRFRHRRRCPRAHRHRPGERHRRRAQRLDDRRPLHPAHQGRHLAGRPDGQPEDHEQRHRRPDRRWHQLPHRRHQLGRVQQLHPQHG